MLGSILACIAHLQYVRPRSHKAITQKEKQIGKKKKERKRTHNPSLPNLLSLAAIFDTSRYIGNAIFDSVRQALQTVADSFGAGGIVDGLAETTSSGANETTCCAREAADCCAELEGDVRGGGLSCN
jgi:hypothetical protein